MAAIKAHFNSKVFAPDEPVNPPQDPSVTITPAPTAPTPDGPAPGQHSLDWVVESLLITDSTLPSDASLQHDHYLYGTPKRPPSD